MALNHKFAPVVILVVSVVYGNWYAANRHSRRKFGNFDMRLTNLAAGIDMLQTMSDDLGTQVSASGCTRVLNVPLVMFKVYI